MGTKALGRNKTNHLIWVSCILVTLLGTPFICHQWGSLSDMGTPPTWEKGSPLPPGTTKLHKLRDSHDSDTAPTAKPDLGFSSLLESARVWNPPRDTRNVMGTQGCTGTLDGLVGSHTRLAIYPTLAICYPRVVIHALLDTAFKGMQVVTYPTNIKQLKSHWLKVPQKSLGTCIGVNKTHNPFWLCSAPWEASR